MAQDSGLSSFEEIYHALVPRAFVVAYRILGDVGDSEDAVAEAFSRAYVAWRRVSELDYRDAWILRVTANVAVDGLRRRSRHRRVDPDVRVSTEPNADRVALATALGSLPRRQREAVALRYLVGLGEGETAACLQVSTNTVKTHTQRGLKHLRVLLSEEVVSHVLC
jgi:RNA polymerase sigma-70 factor (ECF subfamily)